MTDSVSQIKMNNYIKKKKTLPVFTVFKQNTWNIPVPMITCVSWHSGGQTPSLMRLTVLRSSSYNIKVLHYMHDVVQYTISPTIYPNYKSLKIYLTLSWWGLDVAAADPPRNTGLGRFLREKAQDRIRKQRSEKIKAKTRQINVKLDYIVCFNTI